MDHDDRQAPQRDGSPGPDATAATLPIGAFARAAGLSPKALRLYDELGLLRPARVDPGNGYRRYAPAQLDRARLVAWLRRLDMPLVRIRAVCELSAAAAADEIAAYWADVESDVAARRDLVRFLADRLTPPHTGGAAPGGEPVPLRFRPAVRSATGLVRTGNEDAVYADRRVLAVADGFGGSDRAAAAAVAALRSPDLPADRCRPACGADGDGPAAAAAGPAGALLTTLDDVARRTAEEVRETVRGLGPACRGAGTTLTALVCSGFLLALVHIGDSRAYLLRDGGLFRVTRDDSWVRSLVDAGRITPAEAASHPQRPMLLRALDVRGETPPQVRLQDVRRGDRYLLCTDGLSAVVPEPEIRRALTGEVDVPSGPDGAAADGDAPRPGPEEAADALLARAHAHGAPDNVSCVVADVEADPPAGAAPR